MRRDAKLKMSAALWQTLLMDLHRRTEGCHESGAFLLGHIEDSGRSVERVIYYDDLDPHAYDTGVVVMHAASFGALWRICEKSGLSVAADIHVHPEGAWQSRPDRDNPMIALAGHLALIVPNFASPPIFPETLGFFEYLGSHRWRNLGGKEIGRYLDVHSGK